MSEVTREEKLLNAIATGENADFEPITRQEMYLAKMAGQSVDTPEPITRVEKLYEQIILNGGASGGGEVYLGVLDSADRWYEITEAEYNEIMAEKEKEAEKGADVE